MIRCANGVIALEQIERMRPDIVVLDIMMPKMDGHTVARRIRVKDKNTPIIFLTAKTRTKDVVEGFELGANDYLKKPFSMEELIVRIRVQLTKQGLIGNTKTSGEFLRFGNFKFHPHRHTLHINNVVTKLTAKESAVLKFLLHNQQAVAEKSAILKDVWGNDHIVYTRSLDVFVTKLRKHLAADPNVQIINIRGIGYKLVY